ncbi:MAG: TetR/AcrR family transcriptional regulator [Pseudomonadota bacterium]
METRTALLDSAERAARQRGFDAFSYADLARDVGIRKASIHYHFPLKADLAFALVDRYAARIADQLTEISNTDTPVAEKLRAFVALYRNAMANGTQLCLCVALSAGRDSLSEPVLAQLTRFHEDCAAWLRQVFTAAQEDGSVIGLADPKNEADALLALVEGAQLIARAATDVRLFDRAMTAFLARLAATEMT